VLGTTPDTNHGDVRWTGPISCRAMCISPAGIVVIAARDAAHHATVLTFEDWEATAWLAALRGQSAVQRR
jgi:hypothetical protein